MMTPYHAVQREGAGPVCAKGLRWEGDLQAKPGHDIPGAAVWVFGKVTAQPPSSAGENSRDNHKQGSDLLPFWVQRVLLVAGHGVQRPEGQLEANPVM